jgi:hypothetical protein
MRFEDIREGQFYWLTKNVEFYDSRNGMFATILGIQQVEVVQLLPGVRPSVRVRIPGHARFQVLPSALKLLDGSDADDEEQETYTSPLDGKTK